MPIQADSSTGRMRQDLPEHIPEGFDGETVEKIDMLNPQFVNKFENGVVHCTRTHQNKRILLMIGMRKDRVSVVFQNLLNMSSNHSAPQAGEWIRKFRGSRIV